MKERPIIFNGDMVRAILDGQKTQTRRAIKPQPVGGVQWSQIVIDGHGGWADSHGRALRCPYGKPGDRLWIKETWRPRIMHCCSDTCDCDDVSVTYAADGEWRPFTWHSKPPVSDDWVMPKAAERGNVSPLFMPRWASRIQLEITDVRVERLQDISEVDAEAEGVLSCADSLDPDDAGYMPSELFSILWVSINGHQSWHANPWVWVVKFKRLEAGGAV